VNLEAVVDRYAYLFVVALLAIGLYGMLAPSNLVRKIIGMAIFQTGIYLFFIQGSVKDGATTPVIDPTVGTDPDLYVNPLPHLLILTAIVVGVGVLGVAFALLVQLQRAYGTLDEADIIDQLPPVATRADAARSGIARAEGAGEPE
jgi:multicomponent Na+:H+ antiporter subunit C